MRKCATDSAFKLVVSGKLEGKIRFLCNKFQSTEWSGIAFYKEIEGNLEDKNLILQVEDFYLLDVGTAGYTEYEVTPDVLSYQIENDLLDCWWMAIHSHNNFRCFFSGTDESTLNKGGESMNHFVSLIVNNSGEYNARITRIVEEKLDVHVDGTYKSFGDAERHTKYNFNGNRKLIEWIQADIEKCQPSELSEEEINLLEERISAINTAKEEARQKTISDNSKFFRGFEDYEDDEPIFEFNDFTSRRRPTGEFNMFDEETQVKRLVYALITGDLFPIKSVLRCGLNEIISKSLRIYDIKKYVIDDIIEFDGGIEIYVNNIIEMLFGVGIGIEDDKTWQDMLSTLSHYAKINQWVESIYETLKTYE